MLFRGAAYMPNEAPRESPHYIHCSRAQANLRWTPSASALAEIDARVLRLSYLSRRLCLDWSFALTRLLWARKRTRLLCLACSREISAPVISELRDRIPSGNITASNVASSAPPFSTPGR